MDLFANGKARQAKSHEDEDKEHRAKIGNTAQGCQFTGRDSTQALHDADVAISMDGKGRWMDNVLIERLGRTAKYECASRHELESSVQPIAILDD